MHERLRVVCVRLEFGAKRSLRLIVQAAVSGASHQVIPVPSELPSRIVQGQPWLILPPNSFQPGQDF